MQNKQLNWGILGAGYIANIMANAIQETANNKLVAIASRNKERANDFSKKFSVTNSYTDYHQLLEDKSVDIVYIALPNNLHAEWMIKAAVLGKHILCEKPFTMNFAEAKEVLDHVQQAGVFCMEGFMYRSHPQTKKIIELLQQDTIGEVHLIDSHFGFRSEPNGKNANTDPLLGGGSIMSLGSYCISMSRLIAGAEPTHCMAQGIIDSDGVDAFSSAIFKFSNTCYATMTASFRYGLDFGLKITGNKGILHIPSPWLPESLATINLHPFDGESQQINITTHKSLFSYEVALVEACIRAGKAQTDHPAMTWQDTLENMKSLDSWREAIGL